MNRQHNHPLVHTFTHIHTPTTSTPPPGTLATHMSPSLPCPGFYVVGKFSERRRDGAGRRRSWVRAQPRGWAQSAHSALQDPLRMVETHAHPHAHTSYITHTHTSYPVRHASLRGTETQHQRRAHKPCESTMRYIWLHDNNKSRQLLSSPHLTLLPTLTLTLKPIITLPEPSGRLLSLSELISSCAISISAFMAG